MLFSVFCATPADVASAFSAASTSLSPEYDGQNQARIVYDAPSMKAFGYDGAFVSPTSESENRTEETGSIFAQVAKFLAAKTGADSALQGARLSEHLRQLERYGQAGFKELENGSIRYYGNLKPATTPGEMSGARLVREWTPETGAKRTWMETLDQSGTVRSVRPETGGPKVHYIFDANGNYTGTR
jgi:hypothetical protein